MFVRNPVDRPRACSYSDFLSFVDRDRERPLTRTLALIGSLTRAALCRALILPIFIECFGPFHTSSLPRASAALTRDSNTETKTLPTPRGILFTSTVITAQAIDSLNQ